ncbi:MAG: cyclase family protein [Pirellulaceae bacterium]
MSRRIVDLTLTIEEGMTTFPVHWHPFVEITMLGRHGMENRRETPAARCSGPIPARTHRRARHFIRDGETIENIPLDPMVGPAAVLDSLTRFDHHEVDLKQLQAAIGDRPLERLLLRFDWDRHLRTNAYYSNHPFLSEEACEWLVARGCRMIAMDTRCPTIRSTDVARRRTRPISP